MSLQWADEDQPAPAVFQLPSTPASVLAFRRTAGAARSTLLRRVLRSGQVKAWGSRAGGRDVAVPDPAYPSSVGTVAVHPQDGRSRPASAAPPDAACRPGAPTRHGRT